MNGMAFKEKLEKHNLTISQFLDLKDYWYTMTNSERYALLSKELKNKEEKK